MNPLQFVLPEALAHRLLMKARRQRSRTSRLPLNSWVSAIQVISEGQFTEAESAEELLAGARDLMRADTCFLRNSFAVSDGSIAECVQSFVDLLPAGGSPRSLEPED